MSSDSVTQAPSQVAPAVGQARATPRVPESVPAGVERSFLEAITDGLAEEMESDPSVFVLGEDIGGYGGAFKVTKGLIEKFGPERVIETPISELAIVGAAIGAALMGMRPVAEMQYIDFITCAFDQLVTEAGKMRYRTGRGVPMVVRGAAGAGVRGGPFHSAHPEAFFAHATGIKIVVPSTPYDAKGLIKAAIRDPDPVLYIESKFLYRRLKAVIPTGDFTTPIGKARLAREGNDVVCITYGAQVVTAETAADELAAAGISMEILDLRSLVPLDREAILKSVEKCARVLICHEANPVCSISSEVAAIIADEGFHLLDAPIRRVTSPQTPVPFAPVLEDAYIPQVSDLTRAAQDLVSW